MVNSTDSEKIYNILTSVNHLGAEFAKSFVKLGSLIEFK